jgi:aminoglycoside phosphotransferase (APT) family kinase protein
VAEPVLYCADESVTGTPFYVMGFVDGRRVLESEDAGSNPRSAPLDLQQ